MRGLYALKPWYARRLAPLTDRLEAMNVTATTVSCAGVALGAAAGAVIAFAPWGLPAGALVAVFAAARLACANIDGQLARRRRPAPFGAVVNELTDRLADAAMLVGFAPHLGAGGTVALLLGATLPSWAALAVARAGGDRPNGGPMGKTERSAMAVLAAGTGLFGVVAIVIAIGSAVTAVLRVAAAARTCRAAGAR